MAIERHNCFAENCGVAANRMLDAVTAWRNRIADMIPAVPRGLPVSEKVTEEQVLAWIEADKAKTPAAEQEFIKYASFHVLHNAGVSSQNLNHARAGLSKALNGAARWAPRIVNPVDVNGKGILYRFDTRNYWGYTLIDTSAPDFELFNTLSDDDIGFAAAKVDRNGKKPPPVFENFLHQQNKLKPEVTRDDKFARLAWERVLRGNVEAASAGESYPPNIDGFIGTRKIAGNKQEYVDPADLKYVAVSHTHADHAGNVDLFPQVTLLIQKAEYDPAFVEGRTPPFSAKQPVRKVEGDLDVFGDGSMTLISTPGHTAGHQSLLIHLQKTGWVLLAGDAVQIKDQWDRWTAEPDKYDQRLAPTMRRVGELVSKYKAQVWFSHDPNQANEQRAERPYFE